MQTYDIDDAQSGTSSRRHRAPRSHHSGRNHHRRRQRHTQYEQDLHSAASHSEPFYAPPPVARRHTHHDIGDRELQRRPVTSRSKSDAHVDMDLAYGDFHPSSLTRNSPPPQDINEKELKGLVSRTEWLLEEANCVRHTATETIAHLQQHPDAMAAVALTLAEISNLATKMAPATLSALKLAAPTVWALLASPQFLIAAGVGLGVTVVMFGGYKIIKRIKNNNEEKEESMDDMIELDQECLSHVEMWRRGVADAEAESVGTSVSGEFITPTAAAMSRLDLNSTRGPQDSRSTYQDNGSVASSRRSRRSRAHHSSRAPSGVGTKSEHRSHSRAPESVAPSRSGSKYAKSSVSSKPNSRSSDKGKKKPKEKKKGPSRLRQMFTSA